MRRSPMLTRCTPGPSGWVRSSFWLAALAATVFLCLWVPSDEDIIHAVEDNLRYLENDPC